MQIIEFQTKKRGEDTVYEGKVTWPGLEGVDTSLLTRLVERVVKDHYAEQAREEGHNVEVTATAEDVNNIIRGVVERKKREASGLTAEQWKELASAFEEWAAAVAPQIASNKKILKAFKGWIQGRFNYQKLPEPLQDKAGKVVQAFASAISDEAVKEKVMEQHEKAYNKYKESLEALASFDFSL